MKTLFIVCAAIFAVLLVALLVTQFLTKKSGNEDLMEIISLSVGLLMIVDCVVLLLGSLYISGEKTGFWTCLICATLGFLFQTCGRRTQKK